MRKRTSLILCGILGIPLIAWAALPSTEPSAATTQPTVAAAIGSATTAPANVAALATTQPEETMVDDQGDQTAEPTTLASGTTQPYSATQRTFASSTTRPYRNNNNNNNNQGFSRRNGRNNNGYGNNGYGGQGGYMTSQPTLASVGPVIDSVAMPKPVPQDYTILLARSMFMKGKPIPPRQPSYTDNPRPTPPPVIIRPEKTLVFNGVVDADDQMVAMIEDLNAGRLLDLRDGEPVCDGKVINIQLESLDYVTNNGTTHVRIGQNLDAEDVTPSSQPSYSTYTVASSTTTRPAGAGSTVSTGSTGSTGTTGSTGATGATAAELLQRMRERRLQGR
jgi:hypothetical protein